MRRIRVVFWAAMIATMLLATASPAMADDFNFNGIDDDFEVRGEIGGVPVVFEFDVECVEDDDDFDGVFGEDFLDGLDNDFDSFIDEDDVECAVLLEDIDVV